MKAEDIYNIVNDYDITTKKVYFKRLTEEERESYNKFMSNMRLKKSRDKNRENYNNQQKKAMIKRRNEDPEKNKELNRIHNKTYRAKKKLTKEDAVNIIARAYRNKKQLEQNKKQLLTKIEAQNAAKNIVNNLIDYKLKGIRNQNRPKKYATDKEWKAAENERVKKYHLKKKAKK